MIIASGLRPRQRFELAGSVLIWILTPSCLVVFGWAKLPETWLVKPYDQSLGRGCARSIWAYRESCAKSLKRRSFYIFGVGGRLGIHKLTIGQMNLNLVSLYELPDYRNLVPGFKG